MPDDKQNNGFSNWKFWANYGVAGVALVAVSTAFWCATVKPMVVERELLISTLKDNADTNRETMREIGKAMDQMSQTLSRLNDTMDGTQSMIELFIRDVQRTHPEQSRKLDDILKKLNGT